ncbi:histidine kinase,histidine kinase [Actinobacteria bacterium IMCC26256]|nr:histidine kinase,histidine kinase [Actinobacteria bacterium IMCC26256]
MDQLPGEINQRIKREARVAGISRRKAPSIEVIEQRRMQLWILTVLVVVALAAASALASWAGPESSLGAGQWILRSAVALLGIGFVAYAVEKELHLHRLLRLLTDERVLNAAYSQSLDMNRALSAAGKALNSALELDEVLDAILASASQLLSARSGSVMLLEDDDYLRVVAVRGGHLFRDARVRVGESVAGRVAETRAPLLVNGDAVDLGLRDGSAGGGEDGSAMSVPLVNRGQLLGVLNVRAAGSVQFDDYDLQTLSLFAEPVAAAIAKAGLYAAEKAHVVELVESDRMKSQFVASVSHELRTPLTSIRGAVAATRLVDDPAQRSELLDVIERQSVRLQGMVEEILASARMERESNDAPVMLRKVDLASLVRLAALDAHLAGRPVTVDAPAVCEVRADSEGLRRVVGNLIENAHKYGSIPVTVTLECDAEHVMLSVLDSGPGVPVAERARIFERFYRTDPNGVQPGLGLGLSIVRGVVESSGGSVYVEDAPGGGAAFRVVLHTPVDDRREEAHVN